MGAQVPSCTGRTAPSEAVAEGLFYGMVCSDVQAYQAWTSCIPP